MKTTRLTPFLLISCVLLLASCGGGGDEDDGLVPYSCSIPCLGSAPTLSPTTISSATGGTVRVQIEIDGDVASVDVDLALDAMASYVPSAASEYIFDPSTNLITVDLVVPAGTIPGAYYPLVRISGSAGEAEYNFDEGVSTTHYQYAQAIAPSVHATYARSPFAIPVLTITE